MAELASDFENLDSDITNDILTESSSNNYDLDLTKDGTDLTYESVMDMPDISVDFSTDLLDMPDFTSEYVPVTPKPYVDVSQIPPVDDNKTFLTEQGAHLKNITTREKPLATGQGAHSKDITRCTSHLSRSSLTGQGAFTKDISRCLPKSDNSQVDNQNQKDGSLLVVPEVMFKVENLQPSQEYALVYPLQEEGQAEEEEEEEMNDFSEESHLDINAEFDKVVNDLASSYGLRDGLRNKRFYRRGLLTISKREKDSLLRLSDKSITKARREEMIRLCERNLRCIKMYELLTLRIQNFLVKPFRFFTENL